MKTNDQLLTLLNSLIEEAKSNGRGETECLEFKTNIGESHTSITFEGLGDYLSSLSNTACIKDKDYSYLVLGVEDSSFRIVGTNLVISNQMYKNQNYELWLRNKIHPNLAFECYDLDVNGYHVVLFIIPAAKGEPTNFNGVKKVRIGSNNTNLENYPNLMRKIYNSQMDWSAQIINNADISDLDDDALKLAKIKFKENSVSKSYYNEIDSWSDKEWLDAAKITINGKITNTAIILLGKEKSSHYLSPAVAQITWKLDGEELIYEHFGTPFILNVSKLFKKIRNYKYKFFPSDELLATSVDKYSSEVVLEGLNNAIAHQDYGLKERIILTEFDNRIEICNSGNFYYGKPEDYFIKPKTPTKYRNKFLAEAMVNIGMIDTIGYGIHKMVVEQKKRFFPLPDYYKSSVENVVLTIYGKEINEEYCRLLISRNVGIKEAILLDRVQKGLKITKDDAVFLRKSKLIEGRFPNVLIASDIAKVTGAEVSYVRAKGVDKDFVRQQILELLKIKELIKASEVEELLIDKLSTAKSIQQRSVFIKNMLQQMKKEGLIISIDKKWMKNG